MRGSYVRADVSADVYCIMLREYDPLWTYAINGLIRVTPTTTLQIDALTRLNGDEERATALLRLRWRYAPGSDLFVVWREDLDWSATGAIERANVEHQVTVKTTYRFDLSL